MSKTHKKNSRRETTYETCEARLQDEFPNARTDGGNLMGGTITQIVLASESDAGEVVGWFNDPEFAEKVCELLNA